MKRIGTFGIVLMLFGAMYLFKPDIFQRGIWKKLALSQRLMTPEQNKTYMRILGVVLIVIGLALQCYAIMHLGEVS